MNTIVLTISKVILIIALIGPVLDWLFANYPELAFFLVVVASVIRYIFWLNGKFRKIEEKFEPKFVEIDKKFIHVDCRLDKIDTRLDQHQTAVETLDKKVTSLQDDVAKGYIRLAVVETKLDDFKTEVNDKLRNFRAEVDDKLEEMDNKIEKMDTKMDKRFDRLENFMIAMLESNRRIYSQIPGAKFNHD